MCGAGEAVQAWNWWSTVKSCLDHSILGKLLSISQSQSSHLWNATASLLHCCAKQMRFACKSPGTEHAMQLFSLHDYFPIFFLDFPILTLNFPQRSSLYHWKGDDHSSQNRSVNPFTFHTGPLKPKGLLCGSWALTHRSSLPLSQPMCIPWKLHPLFE